MIQNIGLMMGAYIVTRMISFLTRKGERSESVVVWVFAVITILMTITQIIDLMSRGQPTP